MRYNVVVTSYAELSATVEVDAEDEEETREKALACDDYEWDITEHDQHRSVESVEEGE